MKLIDTFVDDSQVVLGDAAGMVSPLFGAGIDYAIDAAMACAPVITDALTHHSFTRKALLPFEQKIRKIFVNNLKKQWILSRIIVAGKKLGSQWPVKIFSVIAFGAYYSRWNKIRILLYPLLGKPSVLINDNQIEHK